jgi:hypothetical protein
MKCSSQCNSWRCGTYSPSLRHAAVLECFPVQDYGCQYIIVFAFI